MQGFISEIKNIGFKEAALNIDGVQVVYTLVKNVPQVFCYIDVEELKLDNEFNAKGFDKGIREWLKTIGYAESNILMLFASKDINSARKLGTGYEGFWLFNKETRKLIIYDNQPTDFAGIRYKLEAYIETGKVEGASVRQIKQQYKIHNKNNTTSFFAKKKYRGRYNWKNYVNVTHFLILTNIIIFIVLAFGGDMESAIYIHEKGGLMAWDIDFNNEYYRMFTAFFLHFGAAHLMNNMLFIFCFGNTVEPVLGKIGFSLVYVIAGLGGNYAEYRFNLIDDPSTVVAGASGAAYGLLGALIVLVLLDDSMRYRYDYRFLILLAVMFVVGSAATESIATWAHGGGLVCGAVATAIIVLVKRLRKKN